MLRKGEIDRERVGGQLVSSLASQINRSLGKKQQQQQMDNHMPQQKQQQQQQLVKRPIDGACHTIVWRRRSSNLILQVGQLVVRSVYWQSGLLSYPLDTFRFLRFTYICLYTYIYAFPLVANVKDK